jgi:peptidoglycan/LPS O-acetylase OafA/YrhL
VPAGFRDLFVLAGYAFVFFLLVKAMRRKRQTLLGAVASSFVIFILFMAFSKLNHDNYYFAVAPLGSIALVGYVLRNAGGETQIVRPSLAVEEPVLLRMTTTV